MKNDSEKERRKYKRLKGNFNIKIDSDAITDQAKINVGKTVDVSATGVSLTIDRKLPLGSKFEVKFMKPNSFDFFQGTAKVAWIEDHPEEKGKYLIGIEFQDLSEDAKNDLEYYLSKD